MKLLRLSDGAYKEPLNPKHCKDWSEYQAREHSFNIIPIKRCLELEIFSSKPHLASFPLGIILTCLQTDYYTFYQDFIILEIRIMLWYKTLVFKLSIDKERIL